MKCNFCGGGSVKNAIYLGMHAFADSFIPESKKFDGEFAYPLNVTQCNTCCGAQNAVSTLSVQRYRGVDYSYTSSNSAYSRAYWDQYADGVFKKYPRERYGRILEVGSNDGYLLTRLQAAGFSVFGLDASPAMVEIAQQFDLECFPGILGEEALSDDVSKRISGQDLIIANNVFNHSNNPKSFLHSCNKLLNRGGRIIIEAPYWIETLSSSKIDQIYHEHVTYLTVSAVSALADRCGLTVIDAEKTAYHGCSIRITLCRDGEHQATSAVKAFVDEERSFLHDFSFENLMTRIYQDRNILLQKIVDLKLKSPDVPIIAVGAAAKGNTFLTYHRLDNSLIDYVTDVSMHKVGKYTPLTRIPIAHDDIVKNYPRVRIIFLSWNISDSLKKALLALNSNCEFLN